MKVFRIRVVEAHECCQPYLDMLNQPAVNTIKSFPAAGSYAEFEQQQDELRVMLNWAGACEHMREIALTTHRTLCGNDKHVETAEQAMFLGVTPAEYEAAINAS